MSKNRLAVMTPTIEFAFSDKISAENSKFSADSGIHGIHGIQFLERMTFAVSFIGCFNLI